MWAEDSSPHRLRVPIYPCVVGIPLHMGWSPSVCGVGTSLHLGWGSLSTWSGDPCPCGVGISLQGVGAAHLSQVGEQCSRLSVIALGLVAASQGKVPRMCLSAFSSVISFLLLWMAVTMRCTWKGHGDSRTSLQVSPRGAKHPEISNQTSAVQDNPTQHSLPAPNPTQPHSNHHDPTQHKPSPQHPASNPT